MVLSDVSDMSRWHQRQYSDERYTDAAPTNSYISSNGLSIYQNSGVESPPLSARTDFTQPGSPSLDATLNAQASPTLGTASQPDTEHAARSTSEQYDAKSRHFSDDSEVAYSEVVSPLPQVVEHSNANQATDHDLPPPPPPPPAVDEQGTGLHTIEEEEKQQPVEVEKEQQPDQRRRWGMRIPVFWMVVIGTGVSILALALGLGLGIGTRRGSSESNSGDSGSGSNDGGGNLASADSSIGGAINPLYYSRSGVFNGSGVALTSANPGASVADTFIFYQTWTGQIQQVLRSGNGSYGSAITVATNAKNSTPLSAVGYPDAQSTSQFHLFYIDQNNNVRERRSSGQANNWVDGSLNSQNIQAFDADLVGMQACYYGPVLNATNANLTGIDLFVGLSATTVGSYSRPNSATTWSNAANFTNNNGGAGIACHSFRAPNTTTYFFTVDIGGAVRILLRDLDPNVEQTLRGWRYGGATLPNAAPYTSLAFADYLAFQTNDSVIQGRGVTFAGVNTSFSPATLNAWTSDTSNRGILNSHMGMVSFPTGSGGRQLALVYQSIAAPDNGDGLSLGLRDNSASGGWNYGTVQTG